VPSPSPVSRSSSSFFFSWYSPLPRFESYFVFFVCELGLQQMTAVRSLMVRMLLLVLDEARTSELLLLSWLPR
jgi:hypothetical protein